MTHKTHDDEASFEGLISFDSVPPPGGSDDVHNARTTVAELPDSFLDELKSGMKAEVDAKATTKLVAFAGGAVDIETAFAQSLDTMPPAAPLAAPMSPVASTPYKQPYPTPPAAVAVAVAPVAIGPALAAPPRSVLRQLRAIGWREVTVAVLAVLMGFALAVLIRALAARLLG